MRFRNHAKSDEDPDWSFRSFERKEGGEQVGSKGTHWFLSGSVGSTASEPKAEYGSQAVAAL